MAGALKKTMIYLGLADGDDYHEESFGSEPAPAQNRSTEPSNSSKAPAAAQPTGAAPADPHGGAALNADSRLGQAPDRAVEDPGGRARCVVSLVHGVS